VFIQGRGSSINPHDTGNKSYFRETAADKNASVGTHAEKGNAFTFDYFDEYVAKADSIKRRRKHNGEPAITASHNARQYHLEKSRLNLVSKTLW